MPGTKIGGLKVKEKVLSRDPDFYKKIGRKGGRNGHTGGFAANPELARLAGKKGGAISRRGPASHPRKDKGIPRKHLNADSNFIEHVETKKTWRWPWSK